MKQPVRKLYVRRPDGYPALRVWHKKGVGKKAPRLLVKCGDCDNSLKIYYGDDALEIGGVHGSVENWCEILLPLLSTKPQL
jgi:hypothetical protein